jgi:hypothetical protein
MTRRNFAEALRRGIHVEKEVKEVEKEEKKEKKFPFPFIFFCQICFFNNIDTTVTKSVNDLHKHIETNHSDCLEKVEKKTCDTCNGSIPLFTGYNICSPGKGAQIYCKKCFFSSFTPSSLLSSNPCIFCDGEENECDCEDWSCQGECIKGKGVNHVIVQDGPNPAFFVCEYCKDEYMTREPYVSMW